MRALRSRTLQSDDNHEHTVDETENYIEESVTRKVKRKKIKRHISEENGQESVKILEEAVVKKKKSKKIKKSKTDDIEPFNSDQASEPDTNISSSSLESRKKIENDNDQEADKSVNNRKIKKLKRRLLKDVNDSNSIRLSAQITNVFNISLEQQQKSENSGENNQEAEKVVKKKKPKKKLNSETENNEKQINVNNSNIDSQQKTEDIVEKSLQKRRNTSLCVLDFCNAVTSTAMKPKRPENKFDETDILAQNCDQTAKNEIKRNSSSTYTPNTTFKNDSTFNKSKNSERNGSIENRKSNSTIKSNNSIRRETFNKKSKTPLSKYMNSVIAISDSPSITNVKKNTFNKSASSEFLSDEENETNVFEQSSKISQENRRKSFASRREKNTFNKSASSEFLSDEENETNIFEQSSKISQENRRNSFASRRETFNRLPQNKPLPFVDNSVITILDSPDRSVKQNTFNKSSTTEIEQTHNDSTKKKGTSNGLNDNLNRSEKQTCLVSSNNCRSSFSKTPKSVNKIPETFVFNSKYEENCELNDIGESILEDVLDISDSPNKTSSLQNSFRVSDNTTITKNNTYDLEISNSSGNWQIHKNNFDASKTENIENKTQKSISGNETDTTEKTKNASFSPIDKNLRKKWLKFPRHSTDAQNVLDQISSPRLQKKLNTTKVIQKVMETPTDLYKLQKSSIVPSNLSINRSIIKKSPIKSSQKTKNMPSSSKKSITKRTVMPNFALIHKKAFEKMENLKEYSERKKERAQKLLQNTGTKPKSTMTPEEPKAKSSRQLFASNTNDMKFNRFGFKIGDQVKKFTFNSEPKSENNIVIAKPVVKPSVFTRSDIVAVANKNKVVANSRDNKRDMLKGVRTNRRFELLMQMRNK